MEKSNELIILQIFGRIDKALTHKQLDVIEDRIESIISNPTLTDADRQDINVRCRRALVAQRKVFDLIESKPCEKGTSITLPHLCMILITFLVGVMCGVCI